MPLAPSFGWCERESSLHSQGEEAAELLEKSPLSGGSKVLKGGLSERGFERERVVLMILN